MFSLPLVFWTCQGSVFRWIVFSSGGTQWIPSLTNLCLSILGNFPELFPFVASQRVLFVLSVLLSVMDHSVFSFPASHHLVIDSVFWMVSSALCYNFLWNISSRLSDVPFPRTPCILWRFKAPLLYCPSYINTKPVLSFCRIREWLRQPRLCFPPHQPAQDPCLFLPHL